MTIRAGAIAVVITTQLTLVCAREPVVFAGQQKNSRDHVVRIGVTLVQVDAVVTDKQGKRVTDLKPENFEIRVDGRPERITNFSYISTAAEPAVAGPIAGPGVKNAPPVLEAPLQREQVRRTIVLVVDDLRMSVESLTLARRGLKTFVDEQMQPGDLVAIVRTAGGIGVLQQFTSNKTQLYATIDQVKWSSGMGRISAIDLMEPPIFAEESGPGRAQSAISAATAQANAVPARLNRLRELYYETGSIETLNYIVKGLRQLPGRKSLVLFSDGLNILRDEDHPDRYVMDLLQRLVDLANRSSVVVYTIDSRGLQTIGFNAADRTGPPDQQIAIRHGGFLGSQQGLEFLAGETGGLAERDTSDLSRAVRHIIDDQDGYYLIGFIPDESTFKPVGGHRPFHSLTVKVKKAGLRVRSRKGFLGETDEETEPSAGSAAEQIVAALTSPFAEQDIQLRLTSLFWNSSRNGSFIYSLLHVDPNHLVFSDEPDGWHKASFDVAEMAFGDNGRPLGKVTKTQTVRVSDPGYRYIMQHGLAFADRFPLKTAGGLQYRVAVRDQVSGKTGTANSFVNVPDLTNGRLLLSGVFLRAAGVQTPRKPDGAAPDPADEPSQAQQSDVDPAIRMFRPGTDLDLSFIIYNAKVPNSGGRPDVSLQIRLFRDAKLIFSGPAVPFDPADQPDPKRAGAQVRFHLGDQVEPGDYVLQVVCINKMGTRDPRVATQWTDLQVTK